MPCTCNRSLNGLVVTEVMITPWPAPGKLRAFADVVLNGAIKLRAIRIVELESGRILVAMPNRTRLDGTMSDTAHPIHAEGRRWLEGHILEAYVDSLNARHDAQVKALLKEAS